MTFNELLNRANQIARELRSCRDEAERDALIHEAKTVQREIAKLEA